MQIEQQVFLFQADRRVFIEAFRIKQR